MPGRVAKIRPGYIVGPADPTPRFTYWPRRISRGGSVAVPGTPNDPVQVIEVRDRGDWIIRAIERNITACTTPSGPRVGLRCKRCAAVSRRALGPTRPLLILTPPPWRNLLLSSRSGYPQREPRRVSTPAGEKRHSTPGSPRYRSKTVLRQPTTGSARFRKRNKRAFRRGHRRSRGGTAGRGSQVNSRPDPNVAVILGR